MLIEPALHLLALRLGERRQTRRIGRYAVPEILGELDALGHGYTYSLLWVAAIAVLVGAAALFIRFSADQIARAQHTREAVEAGAIASIEASADSLMPAGALEVLPEDQVRALVAYLMHPSQVPLK